MHHHYINRTRWAFAIGAAASLVALFAYPVVVLRTGSNLPVGGTGGGGASSGIGRLSLNHTVTFWETGLPSGNSWSVVLGGVRQWSNSNSIQFAEPSGSYYWGVTTSGAFRVSPDPAGVVTVVSTAVAIHLHFSSTNATHPIQHVVVIVLENQGPATVGLWGTYENYLAQTYGQATAYYAACHSSAPNYLAMVAAVTNQCDPSSGVSDKYHTYDNTSLGDLLQNSGQFTWEQFAEGLPSSFNCTTPGSPAGSGEYAVKHVPFAFFENSTTSPPSGYDGDYCLDHVTSSGAFNQSGPGGVGSTSFVNFSFYTPNLCNDGHDYCTTDPTCPPAVISCDQVRQADNWLRGFLGSLLNGTGRYANSEVTADNVAHTAFLVAYDESANPTGYTGYAVPGVNEGNTYGYCLNNSLPIGSGDAVCGGLVPLTIVSPFGPSGEEMRVDVSPYSVAATVEWLFGLAGPNGLGMENPGHLDWTNRWASPGFPTFEWLLGISGNGYAPSD